MWNVGAEGCRSIGAGARQSVHHTCCRSRSSHEGSRISLVAPHSLHTYSYSGIVIRRYLVPLSFCCISNCSIGLTTGSRLINSSPPPRLTHIPPCGSSGLAYCDSSEKVGCP